MFIIWWSSGIICTVVLVKIESKFYDRTTTSEYREDRTASVPSVVKTRGLGTRLGEDGKSTHINKHKHI